MAEWREGDTHEDVATIQRWLYRLHKANPSRYANPGTTWGTMTSETVAALKLFQASQGLPATGRWDDRTKAQARSFTKYVTGGATSNPFDSNQGIGADRAYVIEKFDYVYGRKPTTAELERHVSYLQQGQTRAEWSKNLERHDAAGAVDRIFKEIMGRPPTDAERDRYVGQISAGRLLRADLRQQLAATPEALLREKETEATAEDEDARVYIDGLLDEMGLGELKDWAWEQIKLDHSVERIRQDLRQTDVYKARFAGLVARVDAGLPAMSEAEYLAYEESADQLMRQSAIPAGMRNRQIYADLIAGNVSLAELNERIENGYVRVNSAAPEIRAAFAEYFGAAGDGALAAFFIDKDLALPVLQRMVRTAETAGVGRQFGFDIGQDRAGQIADTGVGAEEARSGFSQLEQLDPLFTETVTEQLDLTAEEQGADAVFELGQGGREAIEKRTREREAAFAGGGGGNLGQRGIGFGSAE